MEPVRHKHARTPHLPWSRKVTDDDKIMSLKTLKGFHGKRVIVSTKMDGESCSMYQDYIHARSIDGRYHSSRDWVKAYWGTIKNDIPEQWRIVGENMYAKHSIAYTNLLSYFYGIFVWNEKNIALSWDDTVEWFKLLGIVPVPVLYDGIYDESFIKSLWSEKNRNHMEGYVVRLADPIPYDQFHLMVGKFVRDGHVATSAHWMFTEVVPNQLLEP
jgi:hypothetical protein